jgi:hypothetical protein
MFVEVKTREEKRLFNQICRISYAEEGYEYEPDREEDIVSRFLYWDIEKLRYIGTFAFKKIKTNDIFDFGEVEEIKNAKRPVEFTKLSILREYRGQQILPAMLSLMFMFFIQENIDYAVALVEPKLFAALRRFYKIPVKKLPIPENLPEGVAKNEKGFLWYKGDYVIPMMISQKDNLKNRKNYDTWFKEESYSVKEEAN